MILSRVNNKEYFLEKEKKEEKNSWEEMLIGNPTFS